MHKRQLIVMGIAAGAILLGGAGEVAAASTMSGHIPQGPTPADVPDVPGVPDTPEPGDAPDVADAPDVPGQPDLPEPGDTPDNTAPAAPPTR